MRNALRLFFSVFELALYIIWCNFAKSNPTQKDIEYHSIFRLAICLGRWMAITVYICMCFLYTYKILFYFRIFIVKTTSLCEYFCNFAPR